MRKKGYRRGESELPKVCFCYRSFIADFHAHGEVLGPCPRDLWI